MKQFRFLSVCNRKLSKLSILFSLSLNQYTDTWSMIMINYCQAKFSFCAIFNEESFFQPFFWAALFSGSLRVNLSLSDLITNRVESFGDVICIDRLSSISCSTRILLRVLAWFESWFLSRLLLFSSILTSHHRLYNKFYFFLYFQVAILVPICLMLFILWKFSFGVVQCLKHIHTQTHIPILKALFSYFGFYLIVFTNTPSPDKISFRPTPALPSNSSPS